MSLRTGIMNMGQRKSQKSCSSESEVSVETYDVFYLKKIKKKTQQKTPIFLLLVHWKGLETMTNVAKTSIPSIQIVDLQSISHSKKQSSLGQNVQKEHGTPCHTI